MRRLTTKRVTRRSTKSTAIARLCRVHYRTKARGNGTVGRESPGSEARVALRAVGLEARAAQVRTAGLAARVERVRPAATAGAGVTAVAGTAGVRAAGTTAGLSDGAAPSIEKDVG
jgi:hypothetical protein